MDQLVEVLQANSLYPDKRTKLLGFQHILETTVVNGLPSHLGVHTVQEVPHSLKKISFDFIVVEIVAIHKDLVDSEIDTFFVDHLVIA